MWGHEKLFPIYLVLRVIRQPTLVMLLWVGPFSAVLESVQLGRVLGQNAAPHFCVGRQHGEQVQQPGILRKESAHGGVQRITAPDHVRRISFNQRGGKGHDIMVGVVRPS